MMIHNNKKSPCTQLGGTEQGDHERKRGLMYIFNPAYRGTAGPFSFEIIAQGGGFSNE